MQGDRSKANLDTLHSADDLGLLVLANQPWKKNVWPPFLQVHVTNERSKASGYMRARPAVPFLL